VEKPGKEQDELGKEEEELGKRRGKAREETG
jgi:hypothetical protein